MNPKSKSLVHEQAFSTYITPRYLNPNLANPHPTRLISLPSCCLYSIALIYRFMNYKFSLTDHLATLFASTRLNGRSITNYSFEMCRYLYPESLQQINIFLRLNLRSSIKTTLHSSSSSIFLFSQ